METKTYRSSKGVTLCLKPVSQFKIDTLRASKEETPVPTYEAKVAGGDLLRYPMDEEIAKNKGRLDEWNAFVMARQKAEAEHAKRFLELLVWECVEVEVPDGDSDWQKTSEHFGIVIPSNPVERKLFYVYNELLGTPDDVGELISQIMSVSQIDEEAVGKIRESFRAGIRRQANKPMPKKQRQMENK